MPDDDDDRSTDINDEHYNHLIESRDKYERAHNVNLDDGEADHNRPPDDDHHYDYLDFNND